MRSADLALTGCPARWNGRKVFCWAGAFRP
jgi:hypothetical protein